jgi:hypothetical protein
MSSFIKDQAHLASVMLSQFGSDPVIQRWQEKNSNSIDQITSMAGTASGLPYSRDAHICAYENTIIDLYVRCGWADHGFNVVDCSPSLAAMLDSTNVEKSFSSAHLPFRAFLVNISSLNPEWAIYVDRDGRELRCSYLFCAELRQEEPLPFANKPNLVSVKWRSLDGTYTPPRMIAAGMVAPNGELSFNISSPEDFFSDFKLQDKPQLNPVRPHEKECIDRAARMCASLIVWWGSPKNDAVKKRLPTKSKRRDAERARPTTWFIGKTVSTHPMLIEQSKKMGSRLGVELKQQHIVRGHFKRQVFGVGGASRRTIWVEPYWRGPDSESAWSHMYSSGAG